MNERIRQLAIEAGFYVAADKIYTPLSREELTKYQEQFAELIVRECAKFLDENSGYDNSNNAWHPEPEDLLKHFGVEE